jgi:hypothetical protein
MSPDRYRRTSSSAAGRAIVPMGSVLCGLELVLDWVSCGEPLVEDLQHASGVAARFDVSGGGVTEGLGGRAVQMQGHELAWIDGVG